MYDINTNWQTVRQIDSGLAVDKTFSYCGLKMMTEKNTVQLDCKYKQKIPCRFIVMLVAVMGKVFSVFSVFPSVGQGWGKASEYCLNFLLCSALTGGCPEIYIVHQSTRYLNSSYS